MFSNELVHFHRLIGAYDVRPLIKSVVDKNNGKSSGGFKDEMCTFCEMAVVWMRNQIKRNQTEYDIINYVDQISWLKNSRSNRAYYGLFLPAAFLLCLALLIGTIFVGKNHTEKSLKWGIDFIRGAGYQYITSEKLQPQPSPQPQAPMKQLAPRSQLQPLKPQLQPSAQPQPDTETKTPPYPEPQPQPPSQLPPDAQPHHEEQICLSQNECRPPGSEPLPKGLVANTSDLQMQPLWGCRKKVNSTTCLFTAAVGIKQKEIVDKMVRKFLSSDFSVMLFHYDGIVDAWKDLEWANNVVHVSAVNKTKWWFAKRFLHPDIVTEYSYIFLWDEDLGVDDFNPGRYVSIVKDEGLEISQPALDTTRSEVALL